MTAPHGRALARLVVAVAERVQFVRNYLQACRDNPDAEVEASR